MGPHVKDATGPKRPKSRAIMQPPSLRVLAAVIGAAILSLAPSSSFAQATDQKPGDKPQAGDAKDTQKKLDEYAEAEKTLGGPAANPECLFLGRKVVSLLWR